MPRRADAFIQGGYYHAYNRGANHNLIFFDEGDFLRCLGLIKQNAQRYQITIIAYGLLPNHYHFLLRQDGNLPVSKFIGVTFNSYVQSLNLRLERSGTLFEGRFKHRRVKDEVYLLNLCRYIHANPVLHGISDDPAMWEYSNYLEWVGQREGTLYDQAFVSRHFDTPAAYEHYVLEYLCERQLPRPLAEYLRGLDSD
ncbi:MAG: transposase [Chloroflexi bacterium]|nr:transposase [Chloroflexota bacterium]